MDSMSLFSLITVSIPEDILSIIIGFLIVGEHKNLKLNKTNIIHIIIASLLMTGAAWITRHFILTSMLFIFANIFAYSVIIKFIYNIKYTKSIVMTICFMALIILVEVAYVPAFIRYISKSYKLLLANDNLRLLATLPERVIQIGVSIFLYKWDKVLINLSRFEKIKKPAIFAIISLTISLFSLSMIFVNNIDNISPIYGIIFTISLCFFVIGIACVFKLIIDVTKTIKLKDMSNKENKNVIRQIQNYLDKNEISKAKEIAKKNLKNIS